MREKYSYLLFCFCFLFSVLDISFGYVICPDGESACAEGQNCCGRNYNFKCCTARLKCCQTGNYCCSGMNFLGEEASPAIPISSFYQVKNKTNSAENAIIGSIEL